jgi:hypothetical protein
MEGKENMVKGYQGVMDLDLSGIASVNHKDLIRQHTEDIEEYKVYQCSLPIELRYENTVVRTNGRLAIDKEAARKREHR